MCIVVAKPVGVDIPVTETLNNCADSNKDGIGFAFNLPGQKPKIIKGFKHVKKLEYALAANKITKEHNLLIHFRFATHGEVSQGNCHPFPLTDNYEDMRAVNCECDCALAHNGTFSSMPAHAKLSDTMKFVGGILATPEIINNLEKPAIKELVKGYCGFGSKLAFLRPSGFSLIGNFELEEGVYYSNTQYKKYIYRSSWDTNAVGQRWCYKHKSYDDCTWCYDHREYDDCEFKAKKEGSVEIVDPWVEDWRKRYDDGRTINNPPMKPICLWCEKDKNVVFNTLEECWLCDECTAVLIKQGGI